VARLECLVKASLPVRGHRMEVFAFGRRRLVPGSEEPEVVALVNGYRRSDDDAAIVRLHSACFTGDTLGSEKCDCGSQLETSLDVIARAPWGILLYLARQEGRGIGLVKKLQAYGLQDEGFDTIAANEHLHAGVDDRSYDDAVSVLKYLGVNQLWLLSNNPEKRSSLREAGIGVLGVQRIAARVSMFNRAYIETKRLKMGHVYSDDAASPEWD
jgi:GTP cyclohydrolase II